MVNKVLRQLSFADAEELLCRLYWRLSLRSPAVVPRIAPWRVQASSFSDLT